MNPAHRWLSGNWRLAASGALAVVVCAVAVLQVPFDVALGPGMWADPQSDSQFTAVWRISAMLAYTAGSGVGYVAAWIIGLLVAREPRAGVGRAVLAGAGLGLLDLAVAASTASPRLRELARSPGLRKYDGTVIDTGLQHHGPVLAAMAVAFVLFLVSAAAGFRAAKANQPVPRVVTSVVLATPIAIAFHFLSTLLIGRL